MIKKLISLGIIVMMILVVVGGVFAEEPPVKLTIGDGLKILGAYFPGGKSPEEVRRERIDARTPKSVSRSISSSRDPLPKADVNDPNIKALLDKLEDPNIPKTSVVRSYAQPTKSSGRTSFTRRIVSRPQLSPVEKFRNEFIETHKTWKVSDVYDNTFMVENNNERYIFGVEGNQKGYLIRNGVFVPLEKDQFGAPIGAVREDVKRIDDALIEDFKGSEPVSQPVLQSLNNIPGGSGGTPFSLIKEIIIPGTSYETTEGRIKGNFITFSHDGEDYRFERRGDRLFDMDLNKFVEGNEILDNWDEFNLPGFGGEGETGPEEDPIPDPSQVRPSGPPSKVEGGVSGKSETDQPIEYPKNQPEEDLFRAIELEEKGNIGGALDYWKNVELKTKDVKSGPYKNLHEEAKKNARRLSEDLEKEERKKQGIQNTANILKGKLWGELNKFFGDYSFGIPSRMCQSIFDTAPVDDDGFTSTRGPEDYQFRNNVATVQGYVSDYSFEEQKRFVYEVSYSLYAGKDNLAYGVFFTGDNDFIEEGDVNLGEVKRGYFVKESEKEYRSVCVKYSSGSICGNFKES